MADLVSGRYPQQNPMWSIFGQQNNESQSDIPALYNFLPGLSEKFASGAGLVTKEEIIIPLWAPYGTVLKTLKFVVTATEMASITHAWWTVRSGAGVTPGAAGAAGEIKTKVQAQSKDTTELATLFAGKTETVTMPELEKSVLVTPENAPFGYVYIGLFLAGTVGTNVTFKTPATATYKTISGLKVFPWFTNAPLYLKHKPTSETVAENEFTTLASVEITPLIQVT